MFIFAGGEDGLVVGVVFFGDAVVELAVGAVVDEGADRDFGDELRDAAGVVDVVVREEDVVEFADAGLVRGFEDAVGVPAVVKVRRTETVPEAETVGQP